MTKKSYFLSADFQANPTEISCQILVFLVIQNYTLLLLSWTAFSIFVPKKFRFPAFEIFCTVTLLVTSLFIDGTLIFANMRPKFEPHLGISPDILLDKCIIPETFFGFIISISGVENNVSCFL